MHAFLKCALFLAALFLFIGCSNPAAPKPTAAPPVPNDASLFFGSEHEANAEASLRRFFADVQM